MNAPGRSIDPVLNLRLLTIFGELLDISLKSDKLSEAKKARGVIFIIAINMITSFLFQST